MIFGRDIHRPQRMNRNDFGDPLNLNLSNILVYAQIPAKLLTFPSASAVLCV